jgi:hypothetical protein
LESQYKEMSKILGIYEDSQKSYKISQKPINADVVINTFVHENVHQLQTLITKPVYDEMIANL